MNQRAVVWHARTAAWHHHPLEAIFTAFLVVLMIATPALADMRLQERSLYINSSEPGATTFYRLSFRYMSAQPVGSVELLFCDNPIPYMPCEVPEGMDVSSTDLTSQTGETGFSITERSTNRLLLSRSAQAPTDPKSAYTLSDVINPTDINQAFSIRIKTHGSTNGSGPQIDFGSVRSQVIEGVELATQVPPMLIFCLSQQVSENCVSTDEVNYTDMGQLSPKATLTAQSQMAVGTNASGGFAITSSGAPLSAGTNIIDSPEQPTQSQLGINQFGINLVKNNYPDIGHNPEGEWANAVVADDYAVANHYKFEDGDTVAYSPNVSLMRKFTVSYILNSAPDLKPGVYTTTINFIASGRF